ncbi:MAG TPA: glycosyltransferase family 39 protein [Dongiaceae bacterium]|nr:glycosyltransferase family 39 protein [Dongiaceae bacterium]
MTSVKTPNKTASMAADWRVGIAAVFVVWALIYMVWLSRPPLLDDVDTVHAEAAREMLLRHDWVTLYTNGFRYLEKAPLMYWCVLVSFKIFGVATWSARLPLMLAVLALALATYRLGRFVYGGAAGLYAAVALISSLGVFLYTRFLIPEVLVALWMVLGYECFLRAMEGKEPSRLACWGFAASCALNILTKGLIGLIFPIGAIALFLLLTGAWRRVFRMHLLSSTLVFLLIAAPWHVLAALRNPAAGESRGFLWFYFINEHVMRFLNKRVPPGYDTVPLLLFWFLTIAWLLPWSAFLPRALRRVPVRLREWRALANEPWNKEAAGNLLFFLWPIVMLLFFSFSTRQEYYTIPAVPGIALLVGAWLARESSGEASESDLRGGRIASAAMMAVGVIALIAGSYLLSVAHAPPAGADLADLLKKNPEDYNLSLGHVLDLTPQALGAFRLPLLGVTAGLFLGTSLNWLFRRWRNPTAGNIALTAMMVVLLTCVHAALATFSPILSSYALAQAIQKRFQPGDVIVIDGEYHEASTLNFYTGIQVHVLHEPSGNLWYGAKFPDAPKIFETSESLAARWKSPQRVFLWTDQETPKELGGLEFFPLARSGGKFVVTNHAVGN